MLAPSSHVCVDTVPERRHLEMCDVEHIPLNTVKVKDYSTLKFIRFWNVYLKVMPRTVAKNVFWKVNKVLM